MSQQFLGPLPQFCSHDPRLCTVVCRGRICPGLRGVVLHSLFQLLDKTLIALAGFAGKVARLMAGKSLNN